MIYQSKRGLWHSGCKALQCEGSSSTVFPARATERVQVMAADVISDRLAGSYDAAVLSSFVQVISADRARRAIKNIGDAVNHSGAICIRGDVVDDSGTYLLGAVMRSLVYLNIYDEGQAYTMKEHTQWLEEAGFTDVERKILPGGFSMLRARKQN